MPASVIGLTLPGVLNQPEPLRTANMQSLIGSWVIIGWVMLVSVYLFIQYEHRRLTREKKATLFVNEE